MPRKVSQRELDLEAHEKGRLRYYKQIKTAMEFGAASDTNWGSNLTSAMVAPMAAELSKVIESDESVGAEILRGLGLKPEVISLLAFRSFIDSAVCQKTFTRSCIAAARVIQAEAVIRSFYLDDMKKSPGSQRLARYKKWVKHHRTERRAHDLKKIVRNAAPDVYREFMWDDEEALKVGYILAMCAIMGTGMFERQNFKRTATRTQSCLVLTKEAWDYAHKCMKHAESLRPVKMPMVIPPRKWVSPTEGGYENELGDDLVRGATKTATASHTKDAMPLVYESINAIQHTPFRVNKRVMEVALALMESRSPVGDLDVHEEIPLPDPPSFLALPFEAKTEAQRAEQRIYWMDAARIVDANRRMESKRLSIIQTLNLAQKFSAEDDLRFFHPAALDFRGRFYTQATGLSHQGSDLQRGMIEFGQGHVIERGSPGMKAWLRHGAALLGVKGSLEERELAAAKVIASGEAAAVAKDPLGTVSRWSRADEPFAFLAWCLDAENVRDGKPSHLMVAVDGSCNGIQVLSLLLRDEVAGAAVNLLPASRPSDIYQMVADRSMERIRAAAAVGEPFAAEWLRLGVNRGMVKRPVMCLPYSISQRSAMTYLKDAYLEQHRKDGPWTDPSKAAGFLIRKVWPSIGDVVVKGIEFLNWAKAAARILNEHGIHPFWVTPDGFMVQQHYVSYTSSQVKTMIGDHTHLWQIRKATAKLNRRKNVNGIVPNLVHSLDATAARTTARRLVNAGVPDMAFVHDSYLVHGKYASVLHKELREAWIETFDGDPLGDWVRQIEAQLPRGVALPQAPSYGTLDINQLREANYFFA